MVGPKSFECTVVAASSNGSLLVFQTKSPYEMVLGNYEVQVTVNNQVRTYARVIQPARA